MGYDVDRFVDFDVERNRELFCAICLDVLQDSIQTPCGHLFCSRCFYPVFGDATECRCPTCNTNVLRSTLSPIPRPLNNMINNLDIKCDYYERGCGQVIKVENYGDHLRTCVFSSSASRVEEQRRDSDVEAGRRQPNRSQRSRSSGRRRQEERQQLLPPSRRSTNADTEPIEQIEVNCSACCYCLFSSLLLLALMAAFIGMSFIGIYYINGCSDYPILPRLLITLGLSGFLTMVFAFMKGCCFEDHNCGILAVLPLIYLVSLVILFIVVYFIVDIHTIDFKTWWVPEVHFQCNNYVVWWSVWLCNITLLIVAAVLAVCAFVFIVTILLKCCVFLF